MWVPSYTGKKRPGEIGAPVTPGADREVKAGAVAGGAISLWAAAQRRGPGVCLRLPFLLPGHPAAYGAQSSQACCREARRWV